MTTDQTIPCPVCATKIPFDTNLLLAGTQFNCPNCSASIGISQDNISAAEEAMKKFEELKNLSNRNS